MVNFGQLGHDDMRNRRLIYNDTYVLLSIERLNDMRYEAKSVQSERINSLECLLLYHLSRREPLHRYSKSLYTLDIRT